MEKYNELKWLCEWCLESSFAGCDIDGGDWQDKAEQLGLLVEIKIPEKRKEDYPDCFEYECDSLFFAWHSEEAKAGKIT